MARHYTTNQLIDMTGEELLTTMDQQSALTEEINRLTNDQRTTSDEHNKRVAQLNIENISDEWARRFEL